MKLARPPRRLREGRTGRRGKNHPAAIDLPHQQRRIHPKSEGQEAYVAAMRRSAITFCRGPAGSGKTYLAVGLAVESLKTHAMRKIVLVRPAVEAGRKPRFFAWRFAGQVESVHAAAVGCAE
ncbi:MAG: hypothetical protein KatS3mg111_1395 [Pirellulaceae bacterium]|nr:MAG: hypothetical protein KatS3mg111_1395 [Pirellulaceae bacterium]